MIEIPASFVVQEECRKAAWESGFRRSVGAPEGWVGFQSTTAPCTIHLAAGSASGPWYVAVDHAGVIEALDLPTSPLEGPGIARLRIETLTALYPVLARAYQLAISLPDAPLEAWRAATASLPRGTEAERWVVQRVGQDLFREGLLEYWNHRCPLTGIEDPGLLRASHIIPWKDCTSDAQRLDVNNGLLLSALWDAAFDQGLVTFSNDGTPVFSPHLSGPARGELRWRVPLRLTVDQKANLDWHRANVFRADPTPEADATGGPHLTAPRSTP